MEYRSLGRTGVKVSPLCLGAMMFGAWGNPDHDESVAVIHAALDAGINFIDTADVYSAGESEEIVAKALAGSARRRRARHQVLRADGQRPQHGGRLASVDHPRVREQPAAAADRLHRPVPGAPSRSRPSTSTRRSARSTDLVHQGKVRYLGSSTFPGSAIVEAQWVAERRHRERFVCEQPPYSILVRGRRGRRAADVRALRHGRHPVEPARRRLVVGQVAQGRRRRSPATAPTASRRATTSTHPGNQAEAGGGRRARAAGRRRRHPAGAPGGRVGDPEPRGHLGDHRPPHDGAAHHASSAPPTSCSTDDVLDRIDEIVPPGHQLHLGRRRLLAADGRQSPGRAGGRDEGRRSHGVGGGARGTRPRDR